MVEPHGIDVVPRWGRFEARFESQVSYANPLQEAQLEVSFHSPSGQVRTAVGFWDGGVTWRVRFAPDEVGEWTYTTACSDRNNTGLHNRQGAFTCGAPAGDTPFQRHGPLRLAENRRYLEHADGTPFFWLADTAWNGPMCSTPEEWDDYLRERVRQGFTVVQWVATHWFAAPEDLAGERAFTGCERIAVNPAFFQRLDAKLEAINQAGLLGAAVLLWAVARPDPEVLAIDPGTGLPEDQAILLARYMVARWGAHQVAFIPGGDGDYAGANAARWRNIGRAVFGEEPHALVAVHPGGLRWPYDDLRTEPWLDVMGYQSGHHDSPEALAWHLAGPPATDWRTDPPHPVINMEPCYENHLGMYSRVPFDAHAVRRALYWSLLLTPTAGVTYGGHGVWGWDDGSRPPLGHPKTGTPLPWRDALTMPAAEQIRHLADLFQSLEWWRLRPAPEMVVEQPGAIELRRHIAAARSEAGDLALVYVPEDREVLLRPDGLAPNLAAQWFDPRTGELAPAVPSSSGSSLSFAAPQGGGDHPRDWLLVLR